MTPQETELCKLSTEELKSFVITLDYKGREHKKNVLAILEARAYNRGLADGMKVRNV